MSAAVAGLLALAALLVAWRRLGGLWQPPRPDAAGSGERDRATDVSIVVPARNEAHNLPALLASLQALQPAPLEIIVVDDHSTDGSGALAAAAGAQVVVPAPLPAGWLGKPWACRAGAERATGSLLLFTDADTVHAPGSLGSALTALRERHADLVSVIPTHIVRALWERLQGVFHVLLLVATAANRATRPTGRSAKSGMTSERRFCIGQYLLFRRDAYERVGGHTAVRDRVAEDLAFARLVGPAYALVAEPGLLRVRMYPEGLAAFLRGWRRNFREGLASAGLGGSLEMVVVIGWLLTPLISGVAAAAAGGAVWPWLAAYGATSFLVARAQRPLGPFRWPSAFAYPLFVLVFVGVSIAAGFDRLRRAPVRWRGRAIDVATLSRRSR